MDDTSNVASEGTEANVLFKTAIEEFRRRICRIAGEVRPCSAAMLQAPILPTYTPIFDRSRLPAVPLFIWLRFEAPANVPGNSFSEEEGVGR